MARSDYHETPAVHDARIWISAVGAAIGAAVLILSILHSFGIFTYESRLSVLESNTTDIKQSLSRIEGKVDNLRK